MKRKNGFSLVELLIVLAVMAALIATITPVALNAIKKAKATQVGQNLKTLASALENRGYVDGASGITGLTSLANLARDISADYKAYIIPGGNGDFAAYIQYDKSDVDVSKVQEILSQAAEGDGTTAAYTVTAADVTNGAFELTSSAKTNLTAAAITPADGTVYYAISFTIY